jgi:simple sugar transport system ATP-binding protein
MDMGYIRDNAQKLIKEFDVRTQSIYDTASSLSGGNKQKVVLARELSRSVSRSIVLRSRPMKRDKIKYCFK